jgi:transcriptional antiterminator RfaH
MHEERDWYVVRSKPRREEFAQGQLLRRGVETFLPRIIEPGRGSAPRSVGPLFPGYMFAFISLLSQYASVIWAPGVHSMVAFGDIPVPVETAVVDFLQERCGKEGIVRCLPSFAQGDLVRVSGGPLEGLVGIVQRRASGRERVQVLMQLLRRRTEVTLPTEILERIAS